MRLDLGRTPVGLGSGRGERADRDGRLGHQPAAVLVVDVDQPETRPLGGEQRRLGREVVLHVVVEVEVVPAEVEEYGDVEDHAVDAAHHQGVAGDLHRARHHVPLAHHREQAVQVRRLGRGQCRLHVLARDPRAHRADHRGAHPGALQPALEQAGGRGLALGAGHADHPHRGGGVAVQPGGQAAEHGPGVVHDQDRHSGGRGPAAVGVGEDGDGARPDRGLREVDPVGARARQRGVQVTGHDTLRGQADAGDHDAGEALGLASQVGAEPVRERRERRPRRLLRPGGVAHHANLSPGIPHHSTGSREGLVPVGGTAYRVSA
jgi:hypothetical protein